MVVSTAFIVADLWHHLQKPTGKVMCSSMLNVELNLYLQTLDQSFLEQSEEDIVTQ